MSLSIHILGAGVVGLTTAIEVQKAYPDAKVTIIAEIFPGDPKSIRYTSIWAGAHHVSLAGDDPRQNSKFLNGRSTCSAALSFLKREEMDRATFQTMWEMSAPGSPSEGCFLRLNQTEYWSAENIGASCLNTMPNVCIGA